MSQKQIKVATSQFPVSGDVHKNAKIIRKQMREAAAARADVVHFCETALTGYAGSCPEYGVPVFDLPTLRDYDWDTLRARTHEIMALACDLGVWVILGSTHYLSESDKPANCLYIIDDRGKLRNRYDKRFCTPGDLTAYSPGNRYVMTTIHGFRCGFMICADEGSPALFRAHKRKGVEVLFHSFYNARFNGPIPNDTYVVPDMQTKAREHGMWIYGNNSSARHSCWSTFVAGPDGQFAKLRNIPPPSSTTISRPTISPTRAPSTQARRQAIRAR